MSGRQQFGSKHLLLFVIAFVALCLCVQRFGYPAPEKVALVTGGLGFIGSHLTEELLDHGYKVFIFDDESNGHNFNLLTTHIHGDIQIVKELELLPDRIDYVVHLAAAISVAESMTQPEKYFATNVAGSQKVLELARTKWNTKMVVAASSAAIYGDKAPIPVREASGYAGLSPYAESKWKMEKLMEAANKKGLNTVALRFFNVYGPRQDPKSDYSGVISKFMEFASQSTYKDGKKTKKGAQIKIFGDGKQTRDFVFVKDVARAIRTALESEKTEFDAFNVCTGHKTTIQQLAETVKQAFAVPGKEISLKNSEARNGDIRESLCDPSKTKQGLGFEYKYTIEQGLKMTQEWYSSSFGGKK